MTDTAYAIVVVTWECADRLDGLVESMNRHLASRPYLVVVDNASSDDPETAARRWRGAVDFVPLAGNAGFGAACNLGIRRASSDVVVVLNPDTELVDTSLDDLAAEASRRRALVGARLLESDGTVQPSASGSPVGLWPWIGAVMPGGLQPSGLLVHTEPWRLSVTTRVTWLSGACIAAPREQLLRLGPFDPSIELFGEDLDLGLRAAEAGVASYLAPAVARVRHHGGASASRRFEADEIAAAKAATHRGVVRRAYGVRRERRGWRAQCLRLALRVAAKGAVGADREAEVRELRALRTALPQRLPGFIGAGSVEAETATAPAPRRRGPL